MFNHKLYQLSMLILVAGCTTQPDKVADSGPDIQCHSAEITGSMIHKSVCTTRAQRAVQQAQLEELRRTVDAQTAAAAATGTQH